MAWKRNRLAWADDLSRMHWEQFERLLADHYRDAGFDVEHCGTAASGGRYDGGVDLVLRREGETTLVQCKHWKVWQVAHNDVHQLLGLLETRGAQKAILITSGEFTPYAREAAGRTPRITLVDGSELRRMIDPRLIPASQEASSSTLGLGAWAPVAEKAVDAFLDVKFGRRRQHPRTFGEEFGELGLRLVLGTALIFGAWLFARHQIDRAQDALAAPLRTSTAAAAPRPATIDYAFAERLRRVSVQGTMVSNGVRTVVVDLAGLEPIEAKAVICREAARWFREPVSGERLQVLRHRGNAPAVDAGRLRCD